MRWATYFAVLAAVLSVGLALGVTMPLVSFRLESWGYGPFAIGVVAAMPAIGVLLGAKISSRLAARFGTASLMRLCLWGGAISIALLALLPSYPLWLVLRLILGVVLTIIFILGESWINQLVVEQWRGRLVALYGASYALASWPGPCCWACWVLSMITASGPRWVCWWYHRSCCWGAAGRRAPSRAA